MTSTRFPVALGAILGLCSLALLAVPVAGCGGGGTRTEPTCAAHDSQAVIDVSGTWDYDGTTPIHHLRGTITMVQNGNTVDITSTTYDNSFDRTLIGTADLDGNRLTITLVVDPDPNLNQPIGFEAECEFLFSLDGNEFCCAFSDTNGDTGFLGSYVATKQ